MRSGPMSDTFTGVRVSDWANVNSSSGWLRRRRSGSVAGVSASADGAVTTPPSVAASLRASRAARWRSIQVSKPATSVKLCMKFSRRNSPSTTIGRSWRSCSATRSRTAASSTARRPSSDRSPDSWRATASTSSGGRSIEPTLSTRSVMRRSLLTR